VGTETYLAFGDEVEIPPAGEIIFADAAAAVHARRWTFRQSRASTISSNTRRALIVSEGLHETAGKDVTALIEVLAQNISVLWGPPSHKAMVTANYPRLTFSP
jgi:DNA/RNA-binding domain of Phe-tRNA-synthetase-like protein